MPQAASKIRFTAELLQPVETAAWAFLVLPKAASAKLPARGVTTVEGAINGVAFRAVFEPDGQKSHWLKVDRKLGKAAGADAGDVVTLEFDPTAVEPTVPTPSEMGSGRVYCGELGKLRCGCRA